MPKCLLMIVMMSRFLPAIVIKSMEMVPSSDIVPMGNSSGKRLIIVI